MVIWARAQMTTSHEITSLLNLIPRILRYRIGPGGGSRPFLREGVGTPLLHRKIRGMRFKSKVISWDVVIWARAQMRTSHEITSLLNIIPRILRYRIGPGGGSRPPLGVPGEKVLKWTVWGLWGSPGGGPGRAPEASRGAPGSPGGAPKTKKRRREEEKKRRREGEKNRAPSLEQLYI